MIDRRGLTLLGLLVSVMLMAIIGAACLPVMQSAAAELSEAAVGEDEDGVGLARAVDAYLELEDTELPTDGEELMAELPWPEDVEAGPAYVKQLLSNDPGTDHFWLVFTCDGRSVARWMATETEDEDTEDDISR